MPLHRSGNAGTARASSLPQATPDGKGSSPPPCCWDDGREQPGLSSHPTTPTSGLGFPVSLAPSVSHSLCDGRGCRGVESELPFGTKTSLHLPGDGETPYPVVPEVMSDD